MHTAIFRCGIAAVGALLVSACAGAPPHEPSPPGLDGTAWVLDSLPGRTLPDAPKVTLQFSAGRVAGSDGCNRYSGRYESAGDSLEVPPGLAATQMACALDVNEQARLFLDALARARHYRVDGGVLALLGEDRATLATLRPQSLELAGTRWQARGINDGKGAVVSLVAGSEVTLEFAEDGGATGSAGCNRYRATWTGEGTKLRFGPPAATRRACAEAEVMQQEQRFLDALTRVATARVEGDRLELRTADGALAVALYREGTD
jgi:heat shock protein HslJ